MSRLTSLSANVVFFGRFLRTKNFIVTSEDDRHALLALNAIGFQSSTQFQLALKSVFCRSEAQLNKFDDLFKQYWKERAKEIDSKIQDKPESARKKLPGYEATKSLQSWLNSTANKEEEETAAYSSHENPFQKDFSKIPGDEVELIRQAIQSISRNLASKISRRLEKADSINRLDLLRTLRKNIRNGSEIVHLEYRKPKRNRTKLVLLNDVSKSMDLYSAFFIQFMYAMQNTFRRMETFVFSTNLSRITTLLKKTNFSGAMELLGNETGWSGGTKIGESLQSFLSGYSQLLNKQTIVIILSDGWDTGESNSIETAMRKIHSAVKKVIWLNPIAGFAQYKPEAKGMQTALPFVDVFAPVHNVESLKNLGKFI